MRPKTLHTIGLLLGLSASRPALAQPIFQVAQDAPAATGPVRLVYVAPRACPDERELRALVASRLGRDPFTSDPGLARQVEVRVEQLRGGGFGGTVELREADGRVSWHRPRFTDASCRGLVALFGELSIPSAMATLPTAPAAQVVLVDPEPPPRDPPAPPAPRDAPAFRLGARAGVAIGLLPGPTAAFAADLGAGWRYVSIAVEGLATLPVERTVDHGVGLRSSLLGGSVVPCGHYKWFAGCALFTVGAFRAEGVDVDRPVQTTQVYVAAGLRAALEWPIVPLLVLRLSADALVNLHPLASLVGRSPADGQPIEVWRSGPFAGVVGAGLVLRFGGAAPPSPASAPRAATGRREFF